MPRKPRFTLPGVPQHVIQRGNNHKKRGQNKVTANISGNCDLTLKSSEIRQLENFREGLDIFAKTIRNSNYSPIPRQKQSLAVAGVVLEVEKGGAKYGLEWSTDAFRLSFGSKTLDAGVDSDGRIRTEGAIKIRADGFGEKSSIGLGYGPASISAEESGMIKGELKVFKGVVDAKAQVGFNILEFSMRVLEPVRSGMDKISFLLSKEQMSNDLQELRSKIDYRIETLRQAQQYERYWVPAVRGR